MINMAEIHEAHQHWQDRLSTMAGQFNATFEIYKEIVTEARNSKWRYGAPYRLEMLDPLYGVVPKENPANPLNPRLLYEAPQITQNYSSETARDVGLWLQKKLTDKDLPSLLIPRDLQTLSDISAKLRSDDFQVQGSALENLQKNIFTAEMTQQSSPDFLNLLHQIKKRLGADARAIAEPGRGFLLRLENQSSIAAQLKFVKFNDARGDQTPAEYLLIPAICGPPGNSDKLISSVSGFSAHFNPPRITNPSEGILDRACGAVKTYPAKALFKVPLEDHGQKFTGLLNYLINNLDPEVLGTESEEGFIHWWEKGPQNQMKLAFDIYATEYEKIILDMTKLFQQKGNFSLNSGPAATNPIEGLRQQMRLDLLIYGEMFKDLYAKQYHFDMPRTAFTEEPSHPHESVDLLAALPRTNPNLRIQTEIEYEFEKLIAMVLGVSLSTDSSDNSDFDAQVAVIEGKLVKAESFLGGERFERGVIRLENQEQHQVLAVTLQGLREVALELSIYGGLMNAVSWSKIRRQKETSKEQKFYQTKLEMSLKKLGSSLSIKGIGNN